MRGRAVVKRRRRLGFRLPARAALVACTAAAALLADPTGGGGGSRAEANVGIFGYLETRREGLEAFPKWTGALERYFQEKAQTAGNCAAKEFNRCHYEKWTGFLDSVKGDPPERQLKKVNDFMNKARYILDPINWGVQDYWATPGQFFDKYGDCEDYAIAKYLSLIALGWDPKVFRIVVVQDLNLRIPHAILAVYQDDGVVLLDNQIAIVVDAGRIRHYRPIFSLSETGWWRHAPAAAAGGKPRPRRG